MVNKVVLIGKIARGFSFSHSVKNGERFFETVIDIKRPSGIVDSIPVLISEETMQTVDSSRGGNVYVSGQFHSLKKDGKTIYFVLAQEFFFLCTDIVKFNGISCMGEIANTPTFRITPKGKEASDFTLMLRRRYNRTDYLPCIAWGKEAISVSTIPNGTMVSIMGHIQSRRYQKDSETQTTYEIVVTHMEEIKGDEERSA